MNKSDLTRKIAEKMSISQKESLRFINIFEDVMVSELAKDNSIILHGFGTLSPWKQSERFGRNPRTGICVLIKSRTSVKFRPGKELLRLLNERK
ncbi:HU family DNA-binding protein [Parabacteroides chongii]|uniref:HU family DNA-binding protein n=1 Tax=Parabacteroides chongii TaxID=2685834 RepID=UPI00240E2F3F|nr:HU family DNA-binding protein [Parabacteroides chongii]WFE84341.1 HU family DNA-binding protein [Parabacteroides chongii]